METLLIALMLPVLFYGIHRYVEWDKARQAEDRRRRGVTEYNTPFGASDPFDGDD